MPWQPASDGPDGRGFVAHLRAVRGAMSEEPDRFRRMAIAANAGADIHLTVLDSLEAALLAVDLDLLVVPQVLDPGMDLAHRHRWPLVVHADHLPGSVRRGPVATTVEPRPGRPSVGGYLAYRRAVRRLRRARRKRAPGSSIDELCRRATIVATTDSSIETDGPFPANVRFVGPSMPDPLPPLAAATRQWLEGQAGGIVLVAFGTLVRLGERQVTALADGLADCGAGVLWALPEHHHRLVERRSPRFRIETFVPQVTLLSSDAVRAFVTHAGANSAVEALYWGRPLLALPFMFDQHHFARRAAELGAGLVLDPHALAGADVRNAMRRLLREPGFADAAHRLATRLQATPGVKGAADIVEAEIARACGSGSPAERARGD